MAFWDQAQLKRRITFSKEDAEKMKKHVKGAKFRSLKN